MATAEKESPAGTTPDAVQTQPSEPSLEKAGGLKSFAVSVIILKIRDVSLKTNTTPSVSSLMAKPQNTSFSPLAFLPLLDLEQR